MDKDGQTAAETRLAKALAHPLRFRILIKLNERAASPSDLAGQLDAPLGNVSYHVQVLLAQGAIELVGTRPVRGALEHIYRATARPFFDDAHWAKLPLSVRRQFQDQALQGVWEHLVEAFEAGGLDDPQTHISWTALDLDPAGYEQMVELLGQTLDRALEINAESANRLAGLAEDERQTNRTELSILHFHRPRAVEPRRAKRRRPSAQKA